MWCITCASLATITSFRVAHQHHCPLLLHARCYIPSSAPTATASPLPALWLRCQPPYRPPPCPVGNPLPSFCSQPVQIAGSVILECARSHLSAVIMVELARSDRSHHHRSHHQAGFFASGTHSHLQASVAGHSNCQTQACSLGSHAASRAGSHSCFSQASSSSRPAPSHFAASASPSSCGARPTLTVTSRPLARSAATVTWRRRARSDRTHHPPPALWFGLHESSSSTLVALASVSRRLHPACRLRSQLHDDHLQARSSVPARICQPSSWSSLHAQIAATTIAATIRLASSHLAPTVICRPLSRVTATVRRRHAPSDRTQHHVQARILASLRHHHPPGLLHRISQPPPAPRAVAHGPHSPSHPGLWRGAQPL